MTNTNTTNAPNAPQPDDPAPEGRSGRSMEFESVVAEMLRNYQLAVARHVVKNLTPTEKEQFAQQVGFPLPGHKVTNQIWLLVIGGFVFVLAGSFVALAVGIFAKAPPELLLTVFTTTVGFLTGLLVQSPLPSKGTGSATT